MSLGKTAIETTDIIEEGGLIRAGTATPTVLVGGSNPLEVFTNALAHPDVPKAGESLHPFWIPNVIVTRRIPKVVGIDPDTGNYYVRVECQYEELQPLPYQVSLPIRGGASLTSIQTSVDRDGNPIQVSHNGDVQRGEVTVYEVQGHFSIQFLLRAYRPTDFVKSWISYVNSTPWLGGGVREWLVTRVDFEHIDATRQPPWWRMEMDFERRPTKWVYTGAYVDENGAIPDSPNATVDVHWHLERDFNVAFPN